MLLVLDLIIIKFFHKMPPMLFLFLIHDAFFN